MNKSKFYGTLVSALSEDSQMEAIQLLKIPKPKTHKVGSIEFDKSRVLVGSITGKPRFNGTYNGKQAVIQKLDENDNRIKEIEQLRALKPNANILQCFGLETGKNSFYVAYEKSFVTLKDQVEMKIFSTVPKSLLRSCTLALEYLHKHFFVHGKLSPISILLNRKGEIKISDIGFVNLNGFAIESWENFNGQQWMAPELQQLLKNRISNISVVSLF